MTPAERRVKSKPLSRTSQFNKGKNLSMNSKQNQPIIRDGHWRALKKLHDAEAYKRTRELYRAALGGIDVFLRPTEKGFTVLSLDADDCPSMIGVGAIGTNEHILSTLPPDEEKVRHAVEGYEAKRESMKRASSEEAYALRLIASALSNGLSLGSAYFITQEWRLPSNQKVDILCADPKQDCLVVIELKSSENEAQATRTGSNAWEQAQSYADRIYEDRQELYPFFEQLGRTLAQNHGAPAELRNLNLDLKRRPRVLVSWPGGDFQ